MGSELLLRHADEPTTYKVFACENFGLYWYGVGELGRLAIHKGTQSPLTLFALLYELY